MEKISFRLCPPSMNSPPAQDQTTTDTTACDGAASTGMRLRRYNPTLMTVNYAAMVVGSVSSSLLSRFYFMHGGGSLWLCTSVQSIGFPLLLFPIYLSPSDSSRPFSLFTPLLLSLSVLIGFLVGLNNFLFSWGISCLPVSTSSLLLSSQLVFNSLLSAVMVKQRLRLWNVNCVVLLTLSSVLLAVGSSHDMPPGVDRKKFFLGFFATLGAAGLFAVYLPIMEIVLRRVRNYRMVMEMQFIMEAAATLFSLAGMTANGGFRELREESKSDFKLGRSAYWLTIVATVVSWQTCFMATAGSVFLTSSLNSGICMTAILALNVFAGVAVFRDNFGGTKAVATVMCVWAFSTYLYAEHRRNKAGLGGEEEGAAPSTEGKEMVPVRDGAVV